MGSESEFGCVLVSLLYVFHRVFFRRFVFSRCIFPYFTCVNCATVLTSQASLCGNVSRFFLYASSRTPTLTMERSYLYANISCQTGYVSLARGGCGSQARRILVLLRLGLRSQASSSLLFLLFRGLAREFSLSKMGHCAIIFRQGRGTFCVRRVRNTFGSAFAFVEDGRVSRVTVRRSQVSFSFFPSECVSFLVVIFVFFHFLRRRACNVFYRGEGSYQARRRFLATQFRMIRPSGY